MQFSFRTNHGSQPADYVMLGSVGAASPIGGRVPAGEPREAIVVATCHESVGFLGVIADLVGSRYFRNLAASFVRFLQVWKLTRSSEKIGARS